MVPVRSVKSLRCTPAVVDLRVRCSFRYKRGAVEAEGTAVLASFDGVGNIVDE